MDSKSYTLIKNTENSIFFIPCDEIERFEPLHNAFEKGIRLTSYEANDYSLYNRDSEAENDMKEAGSKIFGEAFKDLEYEDNYCKDVLSELDCNFNILNLEEIGLSSEEEAIRDFIKNWEKDNSIYATGDFFTYWDGHNYNSIILRQEGDFRPEYERLDEDEAAPILNAFAQIADWEEYKPGIERAYYGGYEFEKSSWEGHIGSYEARLMDADERIAMAQSFTGAEQVTTTSESNGYPKNLSVALIDFEDYEEAEECANRFGLCVSMFMQVDGWNLWSRLGAADSLLEWEAEDFGDDCFMFGPEDEEDFFETILQPRLQEIESCSEYKDVVDDAQIILNHIENLSTNEKVVIRGLNIVDELQIYTMRKHVDNNTIVIGVEPIEE